MDVIKSLGSVLCNYDFQQHIPAFGFGAKMKSSSTKTKHCFSLNGSSTDPFCVGIKVSECSFTANYIKSM